MIPRASKATIGQWLPKADLGPDSGGEISAGRSPSVILRAILGLGPDAQRACWRLRPPGGRVSFYVSCSALSAHPRGGDPLSTGHRTQVYMGLVH